MAIKKFNELRKSYIQDCIVIDPQYSVPDKIRDSIFELAKERCRGQNSYMKYYPGDGHYKPLSEHEDPSKAIFYEDADKMNKNPYAYEMGDDIISDWLFSEGCFNSCSYLSLAWWAIFVCLGQVL